jgi:SAM-dependent methyltransferase
MSLSSDNEVTAKLWGDAAKEKATSDKWKLVSWDAHPRVRASINRRISGDSNEEWLQFVKRQFCDGKLERGLSLGCGWGILERAVLQLEICEYCEAHDIAPDAIATAQSEAEKAGLSEKVRYFCSDLNKITFEPKKFDICFAGAILHHVADLEHLFEQVKAALREGGLFVIMEYVGPARFNWSDKVERSMNRILSILPESYRVSLKDGKTIKGGITRPSAAEVIKVDATEAIRSDEILDLLARNFEIIHQADFGGTLLQFMLADIIGNFEPGDAKDDALLDLMILFEETLIDEKVITSDFTFVVCKNAQPLSSIMV